VGDVALAERISSRGRPPVVVHRDIPQATVLMGQEGVPWGHPDRYALQVMNYILGGGGFDSRLMEEIRSKRGLAYSAYSAVEPALRGGTFRVAFQTENESASRAMEIALEVVEGMRRERVTREEMQGAKRYLVGSFPMRLDSSSGVASSLALWECYGLGVDYPERFAKAVQRVETDEVMRVAAEHLQPDRWVKVIVGDRGRMGL
jgi:zinc protease